MYGYCHTKCTYVNFTFEDFNLKSTGAELNTI
jgi:hypothetical protein